MFADHGAEFYSGSGNDAARAFELASINVANRPRVHLAEIYSRDGRRWSQADREMYYQTSQGSQIIEYDIFLRHFL